MPQAEGKWSQMETWMLTKKTGATQTEMLVNIKDLGCKKQNKKKP